MMKRHENDDVEVGSSRDDQDEIPAGNESTGEPAKTKEQLLEELESLRSQVMGIRESVKKLKDSERDTRESDRKLLEGEEKYRFLFEDSMDAIYIASRDGNMMDANWAILELFGFEKDELMAKNVRDLFVNQEDRTIIEEEINRNNSVMNYEAEMRCKDGSLMDCLITSSAKRNGEGEIICYHGVIRDITERKLALEKLWKEQEKRRNVVINTCHLLHTPLTVVTGNLYLLRDGVVDLSPELIDKLLRRLEDMITLITGELYGNIEKMTVETSDGFTPKIKYDTT